MYFSATWFSCSTLYLWVLLVYLAVIHSFVTTVWYCLGCTCHNLFPIVFGYWVVSSFLLLQTTLLWILVTCTSFHSKCKSFSRSGAANFTVFMTLMSLNNATLSSKMRIILEKIFRKVSEDSICTILWPILSFARFLNFS